MRTLKEALELRDQIKENHRNNNKDRRTVNIIREVRYYANICGAQYVLPHDWTTEDLEDKLLALEKLTNN